MRKQILLYLHFIFICNVASGESVFKINETPSTQFHSFFKVNSSDLSFEEVRNSLTAWKEFGYADFSHSPFAGKKWYRVKISSTVSQEQILAFNYKLIPYGKVYILSSANTRINVLDLNSISSIDIYDNAFYLHFDKNESKEIYIELFGKGGPLPTNIKLYDVDEYHEIKSQQSAVLTVLRTVTVLFIIIILLSWTLSKNILYFGFILQIIGIIGFVETGIGLFYGYFSFNDYDISYIIRIISNHLLINGYYLFLKNYLYPNDASKELKIIFYFNIIMIVLEVLFLILPHEILIQQITYTTIIIGSWILISLFFAHLCFPGIKDKVVYAKELFYFFLFTAINCFIFVCLPHLGLLERNINATLICYFVTLFLFFFMFFILYRKWENVIKENKRLAKLEQEHQQKYIQSIVISQEDERNKIGREIHDSIGGDLSFIKMKLKESNLNIKPLLENTINNVRNISHTLVSPSFKVDDWIDEIRELATKFNAHSKSFQFHYNTSSIPLPIEELEHLYRVIQELFLFSSLQQKTTQVRLEIEVDHQNINVLFYDNGTHFSEDLLQNEYRLQNVFYRVKLLKGRLEIAPNNNKILIINL
ncbi:sensor histidine kinase [Flammeovirga sp. OC4]|uniref:sensor histidine kinase n=1 Tax=Flammeovirga sp. OC4 TaxID=1382345 RepID=UPI0005C72086|nr:histidine kinase [Flammeovirga sp. OC4]